MKNNRAKSFVTVMAIIAVSALVLRVLIDRGIKLITAQNESNASTTLKLISTALENYAEDNNGVYPQNLSVLTQVEPVYLQKSYMTGSPLKGYNYGCPRLEPSGYTCYANPIFCNLTGKMVFTVTTGGLLVSEECKQREEE